MGLIDEGDKEFFVKGSPVTHAKNLKGNLLYIHGTGDDNVHYQNAEMLINELIKNKKQFSMSRNLAYWQSKFGHDFCIGKKVDRKFTRGSGNKNFIRRWIYVDI